MVTEPTTAGERRELKACPFCPAGAIETCFRQAEIGARPEEVIFHWVECDCGARGPEDRDKAEAERLWNTRAPCHAELERERDGLRERLGKILQCFQNGAMPHRDIIEAARAALGDNQ